MSIACRYDYLLSSLTGLDTLGSASPVSKEGFLDRVVDARGPAETVEMVLLSDDLAQRESLLCGEIASDQTDFAVLAMGLGDNVTVPLPHYLRADDSAESTGNPRVTVDALWARYFRHGLKVAIRCRSPFLKAWVGFEVGLRNALSMARAQSLDLDATAYLVAPELGCEQTDFSSVLTAWSAAPDPLAAMDALDKARWAWLEDKGQWYSFKADEIEAYAAKLILLQRWRRLAND